MKQEALDYLAANKLCVLSTVTADGRSQSAIVGYRHSQSLGLLIGTSNLSRKFANLSANPSVSVVVGGWDAEVQYEGLATILPIEEYDALVEQGVFQSLPGGDKYRQDPTQTFIKITPTWMRFTRHGEQNKIEEFTEFA